MAEIDVGIELRPIRGRGGVQVDQQAWVGVADGPGREAGATVHETSIPLRWSDIDALRHVNNVHFADYADEARSAAADRGLVDPEIPVVTVDVEYVRPVPFGPDPVVVRTRLAGARLAHEMLVGEELRARVTHVLGVPATLAQLVDPPAGRDVPVRRSDVAGGRVRAATWFGLVQEARVAAMSEGGERVIGAMVIARCVLDLDERVVPQRSVRASSSVARVGRSSAVIESDVVAEGGVGARAASTIVAFDADRQVSRPWTDREREHLESRLDVREPAPGAPGDRR